MKDKHMEKRQCPTPTLKYGRNTSWMSFQPNFFVIAWNKEERLASASSEFDIWSMRLYSTLQRLKLGSSWLGDICTKKASSTRDGGCIDTESCDIARGILILSFYDLKSQWDMVVILNKIVCSRSLSKSIQDSLARVFRIQGLRERANRKRLSHFLMNISFVFKKHGRNPYLDFRFFLCGNGSFDAKLYESEKDGIHEHRLSQIHK